MIFAITVVQIIYDLPDDVMFDGGRWFQWICKCLQALPFIDDRRDHEFKPVQDKILQMLR